MLKKTAEQNALLLPEAYNKIDYHATVESSSMGMIMPVLATTFNAKTAVEIGVAYGWTADCLAAGLEASADGEGRLISVDLNKDWLDKVEKLIADKNYDIDHICIPGNTMEMDWSSILEDNKVDTIDMACIDGDHLGAAPLTDLKNLLPHMSETGVIMMHDYGNYYDDVVSAVNTVVKTEGWRFFQFPQNRRTNETGCCIMQRDKFLDCVPGINSLPDHISEYHENTSTKTKLENKLSIRDIYSTDS